MSGDGHHEFDIAINRGFRWTINPHETLQEDADDLEDDYWGDEEDDVDLNFHFESELNELRSNRTQECPYCKCNIPVVDFRDDDELFERADGWALNRSYFVASCSTCGFWRFIASEYTNKCMDAPTCVAAASVARRFSSPIPPGCATEIAQYMSGDSSRWDDLSPKGLEILVADIFRANYVASEVMHVGRPGDLGVDVLFVDSQNTSWLIQVKRRRQGKVEGFSTLQSLLGTLVLHGKQHGIIVSTADYFSACVQRQRDNADKLGYVVNLVDRGKLHRMLPPLLPDRPWLNLMNQDIYWDLNEDVKEFFRQNTRSARTEARQLRLFQ